MKFSRFIAHSREHVNASVYFSVPCFTTLKLILHQAKSFVSGYFPSTSGDGEIRTLDPLLARQVLSQLSYTPTTVFTVQCLYSSVFFAVTDNRLLQWA